MPPSQSVLDDPPHDHRRLLLPLRYPSLCVFLLPVLTLADRSRSRLRKGRSLRSAFVPLSLRSPADSSHTAWRSCDYNHARSAQPAGRDEWLRIVRRACACILTIRIWALYQHSRGILFLCVFLSREKPRLNTRCSLCLLMLVEAIVLGISTSQFQRAFRCRSPPSPLTAYSHTAISLPPPITGCVAAGKFGNAGFVIALCAILNLAPDFRSPRQLQLGRPTPLRYGHRPSRYISRCAFISPLFLPTKPATLAGPSQARKPRKILAHPPCLSARERILLRGHLHRRRDQHNLLHSP